MALFTSKAAGNWNATGQTTWNEVGAPGIGDRVTSITHAIAVSANQTVGTSVAAGTDAITLLAGGSLTVNAGITLTIRGDFHQGNAPVTIGAGGGIEFDSTIGAAHYTWYTGDAAGNTLNIITVNGTSGARSFIRSNAGGTTAALTAQSFTRSNFVVSYCDFTRLGQAAVPSNQLYNGTSDFQNCIFDTTSYIETYFEPATAINRFVNCTWKNTVGTFTISMGANPVALTSGTRAITSCVFDKVIQHSFIGYTISDTLIADAVTPPLSPLGSAGWASLSGNLLVWPNGSAEFIVNASMTNNYFQQNATPNPHYLAINVAGVTVSGNIFQHTGATGDGDCVMVTVAGVTSLTIENNLVLPNSGGFNSGTLLSLLGTSDTVATVRHNTTCIEGQAGVTVGETYGGHVGALTAFRDNLCWGQVAATGYKLANVTSTVMDTILSANIHHNGGWRFATGSNLKGYHALTFSSGAPGANDVDGTDPNFVDATRNMAKWDLSLGGAGTNANALVELKKKNEAGYNTAYTIAALIAYVKAGFVPQAAAYQAASDVVAPSNGWIGAVEGAVSSGGGAVDHSRLMLLGVGR